ncbi:nitroreductase/quinone reductase family protein [Intrasporangium flavum]|uniref:nitroreductase/quinone reductase family protein n=1 Tax=Intrasporangium flavum TaxID=1428657 RepID=UPI00096FCE16|nr:nitroreductase/quinone reductase family protein [Intrasporangium flavum]
MASIGQRLWKAGNTASVWFYRRTGGRVGGRVRGVPVLLLTVAGRRTGAQHTTPVGYFEREGSYYVAASAGGRPEEPQWVRNLRAATHASVQIGRVHHDVTVDVLHGADRDAAWEDVVVARAPFFAAYEEKAGRVIPVVRLTPTS